MFTPNGLDWPAWIEAVSAAVTGIFTLVLAIATARLWNSTKGLHTETKRLATLAEGQSTDMKASIAVAEKAADAAVAAQRPWLDMNIEILSPITFGDEGPNVRLGFNIFNLGNTPATNVQFWPLCSLKLPAKNIPALNWECSWPQHFPTR